LFNTTGGSVAVGHLERSFIMCPASRHLEYAVVAPFFWVEPTTLTKARSGSADMQGYGALAGTLEDVSRPAFDKVQVTETYGTSYQVAIEHRTFRTSALFVALHLNPKNGLGAVVPTQYLAERCALKGGDGTFEQARAAGRSLDTYHWRAQQNPIPHPACFMYLGSAMGCRITPCTYDPVQARINLTHAPMMEDLLTEVTFSASAPVRIDNASLAFADQPIGVLRCRSYALESLANARSAAAGAMATGGEVMVEGNFEPSVTYGPPDRMSELSASVRRSDPTAKVPDMRVEGPPMPLSYQLGLSRVPSRRAEPGPAGKTSANYPSGHSLSVPRAAGRPPATEAEVQALRDAQAATGGGAASGESAGAQAASEVNGGADGEVGTSGQDTAANTTPPTPAAP